MKDNSVTVELKSGAKLEITPAPFMEAKRLLEAVANALKGVNIDIDAEISSDGSFTDFNAIKNALLGVITSKEIEASIIKCMQRSAYNGSKITSYEFFDDIETREDFFEICWEVIKVNLSPFLKGRLSQLTALIQKKEKESQKSV